MSTLPHELVSLIHHVQLHEDGWWKNNIRKLILALLWKEKRPLKSAEISFDLAQQLDISISSKEVSKHLDFLINQHSVVKISHESYKMTEECFSEFNKQVSAGQTLEESARVYFDQCLKNNNLDGSNSTLWDRFHNEYLVPTVNLLGVAVFKLLTVNGSNNSGWRVDNFLDQFDGEDSAKMRKTVSDFLSSDHEDTKNYILRLLSTSFLLKAANISQDIVLEIKQKKKTGIRFNLFLDTNFLFSFMGLHRNPGDTSVESLRELIDSVSSHVNVRLYVLEATLDEFTKVCASASHSLRGVAIPPNIAQAAIEQKISGVAARYFEAAQSGQERLSPEDYFRPYIEDLHAILKQNHIEVFRVAKSTIENQNMVDDLNDQMAREAELPEDSRKSYEKLSHDLELWHTVKDRRSTQVTPLNANDWIVTLDYWLLGFDEFKSHNCTSSVKVCLHPASLVQLIQFWTPNSEKLERALIGAVKLPILLGDFDYEDEAVTFRISGAIARFENSDDLDIETVRSIMVNRAIRSRISQPIDADGEIELIRDALIEHNESLMSRLRENEKTLDEAGRQVELQQHEIAHLTKEVATSRKQSSDFSQQLQKTQTELSVHRNQLNFEKYCVWPWLVGALILAGFIYFENLVPADIQSQIHLLLGSIYMWLWSEVASLYSSKRELEATPRIVKFFVANRIVMRWAFGVLASVFLVWLATTWFEPLWIKKWSI